MITHKLMWTIGVEGDKYQPHYEVRDLAPDTNAIDSCLDKGCITMTREEAMQYWARRIQEMRTVDGAYKIIPEILKCENLKDG